MKKGTTNPEKKKTIVTLKKTKKEIWKKIAKTLEKPRRKNITVNLWKINKYTKDGDTVIVPGKILGNGELKHNINIAAQSYSKTAQEKLGNKATTLTELIKKNPKGTNIKIIQ